MADLTTPPPPPERADPAAERFNARLGMALFAVYLAAYGLFVGLNAAAPATMDVVPFAGLNLAVLAGLGLIGGAVVLAVVYSLLCRVPGGKA